MTQPSDDGGTSPWVSLTRRLPLAADKPVSGYAIALMIAFVAWFVRYEIGDGLPPGFPYLTFFPAVIFTAFFLGLRAGILSAVVCGILAWYFFITPAHSFALSFNSGLALAFYAFIVSVDIALIHWMQTANHDLDAERTRSEDLRERSELLFRELQHRVGNNLQMVSSLVSLQRGQVSDPKAREALDVAAQRLGLIGRIQRQLYDPGGTQIGLAPYIDEVAREVIAVAGSSELDYTFHSEVETVIAPNMAIPTAIIVAELVSNVIEHGFGSGEAGTIDVYLEPHPEGVELTVLDNGKGLPDGFDLASADSLGLSIVAALAQTVGGGFSLKGAESGQGTEARFRISLDKAAGSSE